MIESIKKEKLCITKFDFDLSNDIEFQGRQNENTSFKVLKASKLRFLAPSFKHRECCGIIRDILNRQGSIDDGVAEFDNKLLLSLYNVFNSLFANNELVKAVVDDAEYCIDTDFLDSVLEYDMEKIIKEYIKVFFLQSTKET